MAMVAGYKISSIVVDDFALDGGAMFGSVPKTLWSKKIEPDAKNRIPLSCRLLILEKDDQKVVIDLGVGAKWKEKHRDIYDITNKTELVSALAGVSDILITHLHFDHVGGISKLADDQSLELNFPQANVFVSKSNYEYAQNPSRREVASYLEENLKPLGQSKLNLFSDGDVLLDGIQCHIANGHTEGLAWFEVSDSNSTVVYPSDLLPTSHHIPVPYVMGYDICAKTSLDEKEQFLAQAQKNNWIVVFEHDRHVEAGRIGYASGRFYLKEEVKLSD
jgi:glyoxylase-like metal-dependent hydrolase (beta-lactamase superfamily II)